MAKIDCGARKIMYLYHISAGPGIRDDCIEEYMTIAPNQKEAIKRFRQVLRDNNNKIGYKDQVYCHEWWDIDRLELKDGLELIKYGGDVF